MNDLCEKCGLNIVFWVIEIDDVVYRLSTFRDGAEGPYGEHETDEHPGLCCDCVDVSIDMPENGRLPVFSG